MPQHHFDPNLVVWAMLHGPAKVLKQSFLSGLINGDEGGTRVLIGTNGAVVQDSRYSGGKFSVVCSSSVPQTQP